MAVIAVSSAEASATATHQLLRLIADCLTTPDRSAAVIRDAVGYFTTRPTRLLRAHYTAEPRRWIGGTRGTTTCEYHHTTRRGWAITTK